MIETTADSLDDWPDLLSGDLEDAVRLAMQVFGVPDVEARFIVLVERGLIPGDVLTEEQSRELEG